eukprot:10788910-Alexandrium_andersonii.AAC.1
MHARCACLLAARTAFAWHGRQGSDEGRSNCPSPSGRPLAQPAVRPRRAPHPYEACAGRHAATPARHPTRIL